jgi:ABC-type sugar transport system permease subunit
MSAPGTRPKMQNADAEPVIFRNNRFWLAIVITSAFVAAAFALGSLAGGFLAVFPLRGFNFHRLITVISLIASGGVMFVIALQMWGLGIGMGFYEARLDSGGVHFRFGSKERPNEQSFAWDQIASINHKRVAKYQYFAVAGKDDRVVEYTSYTFFRPKKLSRLIAARAGQSIQEI